MAALTLPTVVEVATNAPWNDALVFFTNTLAVEQSVVGCTFRAALVPTPGYPATARIDLAPYITLDGNTLYLSVPEAVTATWAPGMYDFDVVVTWPDTISDRIIKGKVRVEVGGA